MLILIEKIIVKDRIRKDFGNIQELADDIKENGLINPPVINKNYELLAGERRLRACKSLGWEQIPVTMMDTRDARHDLEVEISENETRKDFSRTERESIYTRKVQMKLENKDRQINLTKISIEEQVANEMGTSRTNMRKEREIIENKDLLDPSDFADWDEGKLSTNKAYQKIKAREVEKEREIKALKDELRKEKEKKLEVREVVKTVVPEDYESLKKNSKARLDDYRSLEKERMRDQQTIKELKERISDLIWNLGTILRRCRRS